MWHNHQLLLSLLALSAVAVLMVAAPKPSVAELKVLPFGARSDRGHHGGSWVSVPSVSQCRTFVLSVWLLSTFLALDMVNTLQQLGR
jgi:hypothetical protein